ncbi:MAG: hypothetical protein ABI165_14585 [Bryobacteraceae bacterium]
MNPFDRLNAYLRRLERRLRWMTVSRGAAVLASLALAVTLALVLIANRFAFSPTSLLWARTALFVSLALALGFGLVGPLLRQNRRRAARRVEETYPEFQERLLTVVERGATDPTNPFLALVASDAADIAEQMEPDRLAPRSRMLGLAGAAGAAAGVLLWLILAGPGYFGYGAAMLWAGGPHIGSQPFYDIVVRPGNHTVRKRADQLVTAQPIGFQPGKVRLFASYGGAPKWEEAAMQPQPEGSGYGFLFAGLAENVQYYVQAGALKSAVYTLKVVDLPHVKKIRVTYHYPGWSGMKDVVEDPGGDLRAVEGTVAEVAVETDRPLTGGVIALDDGKQIKLEATAGNWVLAKVPIEKDGLYHFGAIDQGQVVRLSEDYFIEARKDSPPTVRITKPARDAKVNPIAEITLAAAADDDFGLYGLELHYAVNGGEEKTVALLPQHGAKHAEGKTTIALEDFKLQPGDLVSVYATAKDARKTTKTDMFFIEATPFEYEYSQAQSSGGAAGQGAEESHISDRQKEILAATWNELKGDAKNKSAAADDARFLTEVQGKLRDQAKTLAERMKSRELSGANSEFQSFSKDMEGAAKSMDDAVAKLKPQHWKEALTPEQKALQQLLRAEATFRQIQVAFGNRGGGGGGGGSARDLESLFDLELDTEKNQYETAQQSASSDQRQRQVDEALEKLKELARRQQELAQRENQSNQSFQQRWEQEMLRREAEQLQKQMEQMTRGNSAQQQAGAQGQSQSQSQSPGQKPQQSGSPGASGQSTNEQRLQEAFQRLSQATDDMRRASQSSSQQQQSGQSGQQSQADARRAADRLKEAQDLLGGLQHREAEQQLSDLAQRADKLAQTQRDFDNRLRAQFGNQAADPRHPNTGVQPGAQPGTGRQSPEQLADEKAGELGELDKLESDMQKTMHDLAATRPGVSSKLREALGNEQQEELKLRMKLNSTYIRRGWGSQVWMAEQPVTQGLEELRDGIKQAQNALGGDPQQQQQQAGSAGNEELQKALARVEQLRQQLQQLAQRGQPGQPGQGAPGNQRDETSQRLSRMAQQPGDQAGQQPGQQAGQQPGQQGGRQAGQQPGRQAGGQRGGGGPVIGSYGDNGEQAYRDTLRDLGELRGALRTSPEFGRDVNRLLDSVREYDPNRVGDAGVLRDRLTRAVLPGLEQLEMELRRKVDPDQSSQVRSGGAEPIPAGYADAVAEYFRKLSKSK